MLTSDVTRLVATASPAGGTNASGGAFAGIQDVRVELRFGCLALKVHARTREVLTLVWLDGRAAGGGAEGKDDT